MPDIPVINTRLVIPVEFNQHLVNAQRWKAGGSIRVALGGRGHGAVDRWVFGIFSGSCVSALAPGQGHCVCS